MDTLKPEERSALMAKIKGKDTKPEILIRKYLFSKGLRFRKNDKRYPGKPDLVLPKYHVALFVNGCFWHRHPDCKIATTPRSNQEYWQAKFAKNIANDKKKHAALEEMGWRVLVVWECELSTLKKREERLPRLYEEITGHAWVEDKDNAKEQG